MTSPRVLVTEPIAQECLDWISTRFETVRDDLAEVHDQLGSFDALVVRTYTQVNDDLLMQMPSLKVVGRAGVGLDNIDLDACQKRGVAVVYTPEANTDSVVEFVLGNIIDGLRTRHRLSEAPSPSEWKQMRDTLITPRQLHGATLGILGFGRIGTRLALAAQTLGMRVLFCDIKQDSLAVPEHLRADRVSREELLKQADVLSIHVDGRPENKGLLTSNDLSLLKDDCVLINTSRGFILDALDIRDWLKANPKAQAFIDVHNPEPIPNDYPLLAMPGAYCTPHIAAASAQAKLAMSRVVEDVARVLEGQSPRFLA